MLHSIPAMVLQRAFHPLMKVLPYACAAYVMNGWPACAAAAAATHQRQPEPTISTHVHCTKGQGLARPGMLLLQGHSPGCGMRSQLLVACKTNTSHPRLEALSSWLYIPSTPTSTWQSTQLPTAAHDRTTSHAGNPTTHRI